jgi:N-acetylneuraminic acid mutarotase
MNTGGTYTATGFAKGNYQSVTDADGILSAALAKTSSDSDSFTISAGQSVIGGVAVTDFARMAASYGSNTRSGASEASDNFTVTQNSLVVFIGLASSQQSISVSGIPGLQVDAISSEPEAMIVAHANLSPGTYTALEQSQATSPGQDPNHMADLLGVFVFSGHAHNTWTSGAPMPVPLDGTAVAVLENQIYIVGGGNDNSSISADTQIYDPATNTWSTGVPLPTATEGGCAAAVNNVLYFIGGNTSPGTPQYTDAVWAYNPKKKAWSSKAPMPTTAEAGAVCVVEKGIIWVMGGYGDGNFLATVEGYNPKTDTWQPGASMLSPEDSASGALIGTTIFVTNGSDNYVDGHNQGYSAATNRWALLNSDPTLRQSACGGSIGGRLYSAGGWAVVNNEALTLTESFTLSTNAWKTLAPMPQGMMGLGRSVVYKGRLYCFGGVYSAGGNVVGTVEIYQP